MEWWKDYGNFGTIMEQKKKKLLLSMVKKMDSRKAGIPAAKRKILFIIQLAVRMVITWNGIKMEIKSQMVSLSQEKDGTVILAMSTI